MRRPFPMFIIVRAGRISWHLWCQLPTIYHFWPAQYPPGSKLVLGSVRPMRIDCSCCSLSNPSNSHPLVMLIFQLVICSWFVVRACIYNKGTFYLRTKARSFRGFVTFWGVWWLSFWSGRFVFGMWGGGSGERSRSSCGNSADFVEISAIRDVAKLESRRLGPFRSGGHDTWFLR